MLYEIEVPFDCPYCGAPVTMLVDPSVPAQTYVEDCEVCCRPIEVSYRADGEAVTAFDVRTLDD